MPAGGSRPLHQNRTNMASKRVPWLLPASEISYWLLPCGAIVACSREIAVRQGYQRLRAALLDILGRESELLSPRMFHMIGSCDQFYKCAFRRARSFKPAPQVASGFAPMVAGRKCRIARGKRSIDPDAGQAAPCTGDARLRAVVD